MSASSVGEGGVESGETQTSGGGTQEGSGEDESGDDADLPPEIKLDVLPPPNGGPSLPPEEWPPLLFDFGEEPPDNSPCEGGMPLFSTIWIANSPEGTVSKIDTQTMVELGRYRTRPDSAGDPSRTSVSLEGDVAIANRSGGLTKIYALPERCADTNGTPGIQTSSGADDVLPWSEEECVAWYRPLDVSSQRVVAWLPSEPEPDCSWPAQELWTAGKRDNDEIVVELIDGEDGSLIEQQVFLSPTGEALGPYGGVVDAVGNLWFTELFTDTVYRIDHNDLSYQFIPMNSRYGVAMDSLGRLFTCGFGFERFDPSMMSLVEGDSGNDNGALGGCMVDGEGVLWMSVYHAPYRLLGYDIDTLELVHEHPIPTHMHGISVDFAGNIWGVEFEGERAFRVDPNSGSYEVYDGLVGAYTYSDMTGFALANVQ